MLAPYIVAMAAAVAAVASLLLDRYDLTDALLGCRISGYGALAFLALTLAAVPVLRIAGWCGLRGAFASAPAIVKHGGRCAALLSLVHALLALTTYLGFDWLAVWQVTYLRSGAAAAVLLGLLLATSSERVNKALGWRLLKPLHRLVYVVPVLVLHHLLLSPFASRSWTLVLFAALAALLLVRLVLPTATSRGRTSSV